ncbi:hypothetical protein Rcae01_01623 [Novipirellula caenicola]|uniref:Uncharacterized protein n=1 Tax=Novipirellula caenicola TaxID=1536901 RepID=A0ABP9VN16_9BACT
MAGQTVTAALQGIPIRSVGPHPRIRFLKLHVYHNPNAIAEGRCATSLSRLRRAK